MDASGLRFEQVSERTIRVAPAIAEPRPEAPQGETRKPAADEPVTLPELLVRGIRSLNADIKCGIDDPRPYVVFNREDLERSGAASINDFILKRVTASNSMAPASQTGDIYGDRSGVNLRGLGEGQTLVLIDGRRVASASTGFSSGQPNLNGIPLAAVERIEVLPTSASAIYGGSATGGVVNVILRRDFQGGEVTISHDNSFDTDSTNNRIDLTYGFTLNAGRTNVMLSASHAEANALLGCERDFVRNGMEHIARNSPGYLVNAFRPGATPNISSASGADLVLDDGTALDSPITYAPAGYRGAGSDGGAALVGNAGRFSTGPSPDATWYGGAGSLIGAVPRSKAFGASVRHDFSGRLSGFLDLSSNQVDSWQPNGSYGFFTLAADDPRNPFQQPINIVSSTAELNARSTMFNEADRASAGLVAQLGGDWAGAVDFTWSRARIGFIRRVGPIDYGRMLADGHDPLDATVPMQLGRYMLSDYESLGMPGLTYTYNPTLRFSGPLWALPGGAVSASFLLEQQRMEYGEGMQWITPYSGLPSERASVFPSRSQRVRSAYAEFTVPMVGQANSRAGIQALDLQLALRHDDYDSLGGNYVVWFPNSGQPGRDFEPARNSVAESSYLVGLKYEPVQGLVLRASRGTGFVPPEISQLGAPTVSMNYLNTGLLDPRRGYTGSPLPMTYITASNPDLGPERSGTTSFGVILQPEALPGFRASLDYTRLRKRDNITTISPLLLLEYEEQFPDRIRRGDKLPGDPAGWSGPIVYMDTSYINAASARYETMDLQFRYGLDLADGAYLEFQGNGTWTLAAEMQAMPGLPANNLRNISMGGVPLNFRGIYGASYERGDWTLGWSVRHYSSYLVADPALAGSVPVIAAQGNGGQVPRQLYHDLSAGWRPSGMQGGGGAMRALPGNLEVRAGIRNIFDKEPPVDLSNRSFYYSYLGDIRLRTYYLQLNYMF